MKKLLILLMTGLFTLPACATCSLDGNQPCTASVLDDNPTLQERAIPNHLEQLKKTDAFQPKYQKPYYDALINTRESTQNMQSPNYNSNCQFGVCLPGVGPSEGEFVD